MLARIDISFCLNGLRNLTTMASSVLLPPRLVSSSPSPSPSNVYTANSLRTMHNCTLDAKHQTSDAHTQTQFSWITFLLQVFFSYSSFSSYFNLSYLPAAVTVVCRRWHRGHNKKNDFLMLRSELSRKIKQQLNRKKLIEWYDARRVCAWVYRRMNRNGDHYTLNSEHAFFIIIQVVFPVHSTNVNNSCACLCLCSSARVWLRGACVTSKKKNATNEKQVELVIVCGRKFCRRRRTRADRMLKCSYSLFACFVRARQEKQKRIEIALSLMNSQCVWDCECVWVGCWRC